MRISRQLLLHPCLFLLIQVSEAQSPGGVSGNLRGWYKGDAGITLTGGAVSQWNDNSGLGNHGTQTVSARRPGQFATAFNFNNALTFNGADDYLNLPDLMSSTVTALSVFAVARQVSTAGDAYGCIIIGQTNNVGSGGG